MEEREIAFRQSARDGPHTDVEFGCDHGPRRHFHARKSRIQWTQGNDDDDAEACQRAARVSPGAAGPAVSHVPHSGGEFLVKAFGETRA